ncbi:MAG: FAD binding domain-containing protein, partial [Rhodospirillaceae bacterium]|nr:FAD binding domain-containing protein [Rhodospirillaceae bacterium]
QAKQITDDEGWLHLGALVKMSVAAEDPAVVRNCPVIAQSLLLAASPQIRNMATLGGNVLQRTRCTYFRDVSWAACNKRSPGSGCAAMDGVNRSHAVLGGSEACIATYHGDFAQALVALEATVELVSPRGTRTIPFEHLHRLPAATPHIENDLYAGEMITKFSVPKRAWMKRSLYLKVRDRQSYEFALSSVAVALDLRKKSVVNARLALGGLATKPWRAREAERVLEGKTFSEAVATKAAEAAFAGAQGKAHNTFKIDLGRRAVVRALMQAAAMEV